MMRREDSEGWGLAGGPARVRGRAATRAVTILLILAFLALMALLAWRMVLEMRDEPAEGPQGRPPAPAVDGAAESDA